jgi:hypothetical protein
MEPALPRIHQTGRSHSERVQIIRHTIEGLEKIAESWRREKLARGKDISDDISLNYNELIRAILGAWLECEKQALRFENEKARKRIQPSKKRRKGSRAE